MVSATVRTILDKAIRAYQEQKFWDETNAAFAALRQDPAAWREELEERGAWNGTLTDGPDDQ